MLLQCLTNVETIWFCKLIILFCFRLTQSVGNKAQSELLLTNKVSSCFEPSQDDDAFLESIRLQDDVVVKGHINMYVVGG